MLFVTPRQLLQLRTSQLNLPPCINDADGVCTMEPIDDTHGPVRLAPCPARCAHRQ